MKMLKAVACKMQRKIVRMTENQVVNFFQTKILAPKQRPGCATQGETFEELLQNLYEAVEGCLSVDVEQPKGSSDAKIVEIAV